MKKKKMGGSLKTAAVKGFTLIELIVVIAIIGVLSAILIISVSGYMEEAYNTADVQQATDIKHILEVSIALSDDLSLSTENAYDITKGGYVYVDSDEIRTSSMAVAQILADAGYIRTKANGEVANPDYRNGETTFGWHNSKWNRNEGDTDGKGWDTWTNKKQANIFCRSKKSWVKYQISWKSVNGNIAFYYSAAKTDQAYTVGGPYDASEDFAARCGGEPNTTGSMGNSSNYNYN